MRVFGLFFNVSDILSKVLLAAKLSLASPCLKIISFLPEIIFSERVAIFGKIGLGSRGVDLTGGSGGGALRILTEAFGAALGAGAIAVFILSEFEVVANLTGALTLTFCFEVAIGVLGFFFTCFLVLGFNFLIKRLLTFCSLAFFVFHGRFF